MISYKQNSLGVQHLLLICFYQFSIKKFSIKILRNYFFLETLPRYKTLSIQNSLPGITSYDPRTFFFQNSIRITEPFLDLQKLLDRTQNLILCLEGQPPRDDSQNPRTDFSEFTSNFMIFNGIQFVSRYTVSIIVSILPSFTL